MKTKKLNLEKLSEITGDLVKVMDLGLTLGKNYMAPEKREVAEQIQKTGKMAIATGAEIGRTVYMIKNMIDEYKSRR